MTLELLAELRGALTEYEITSELHEDVGGLAVTTGAPGAVVWVFVNHGGRYFSWNRADCQHPVRDLAGAARRIAEQATRTSNQASTDGEAAQGVVGDA